ncbi:MAG: hypothetical protein ACLRS1_03340 [Oscillospiraceae bacterium]
MRKVNILWTGGWDSTYRMVELSKENVTVQAIYCCDFGRHSIEKEKETIEEIRKALIEKPETKATFLPICYIDIENIPANSNITKAYHNICEKVKLGSQYEWLARLTQIYPNLEIGIEKPAGEYSGCVDAINTFGRLKSNDNGFEIDREYSSDDCISLFGGFCFPIINMTELDMVRNIREWGYEDIMKKIWFCHSPVNGKSCGVCRPCQQKMECGMAFLVDKRGQERYRVYKLIKNVFGNKVANIISKVLRRL